MYTIPSKEVLERQNARTPLYMWPNYLPQIVISEAHLDDQQCDDILNDLITKPMHKFPGCHATTTECERPVPGMLQPLKTFAYNVNKQYWNYNLDLNCGAYMQTYKQGDFYQIHTDGEIGQTRKLTVIALLSDPSAYDGGVLRLTAYPNAYDIPRTRGTLIAFTPWLLHEVLPVTRGLRQTINMGFWGPPFK